MSKFFSAIFDSSVSVNPGQTTLGKGLSSWAKFGSTVSRVDAGIKQLQSTLGHDKTRAGHLDDPIFAQQLCNGDINMRKVSRRAKDDKYIPHYGDWYISPLKWNQKYQNLTIETPSLNFGM